MVIAHSFNLKSQVWFQTKIARNEVHLLLIIDSEPLHSIVSHIYSSSSSFLGIFMLGVICTLDYPHSYVSVMFYTRFLTHGYTKHRCELLWITRSRLIILKCRKLVLRLSRQSWGAKHQSCPEILNCTCIYAISYTIGNVGSRLGCDQENRDPTFSFPNKLNKCFFD